MHTLLIANRGEIALRVMRTATRMGIRTVAIFTDLDADAPHVRAADDAVRVESYLDIDAVVAAAQDAGADAVHPGYGFLSERAAFARALEAAGIKLVGPSAEVMDRMGRKDAAREIAVAAGVPVVPRGEDASGFPGAGEGRGRRRRQGHADRPLRRRSTTRRSPPRSARRCRRSATTRSWSRSTSSTAGTSRCRSWPTRTATSSTSSSATAPPSAGTRRCWRRRPRRRSRPRSASSSPAARSRSPSTSATRTPAPWSSCSTPTPARPTSWR